MSAAQAHHTPHESAQRGHAQQGQAQQVHATRAWEAQARITQACTASACTAGTRNTSMGDASATTQACTPAQSTGRCTPAMSTTLTSGCRTIWENAAQVHHTPSTKARSTRMHSKGTHNTEYAQQGHAQQAHAMRARCCGPPSHRSRVQLVSATPRKMPPRPGAPRRVRT